MGFVAIYFIWKHFTDLAVEFDKKKWLHFFIALAVFYGTMIGFGFLLGVVLVFIDSNLIDSTPSFVFDLIALPVGILGLSIYYKQLKKRWKREIEFSSNSDEVLDNEL